MRAAAAAGVAGVNYCARIDSRIFGREREARARPPARGGGKKKSETTKMAEAPTGRRAGRRKIHSAANGPGNKAAGPNFRYSAPPRIYYSAYGRGGLRVTHVHFNAITASCRTSPGRLGRQQQQQQQGRLCSAPGSTKDSLYADISLFSLAGIFARCRAAPPRPARVHFDPHFIAAKSCEESASRRDGN